MKAGTKRANAPNKRQYPTIFRKKVPRFFGRRDLASAQNMARAAVSTLLSLLGGTTFQRGFATDHSAIEQSTASVGWCSSGWDWLTKWRTVDVLPGSSPRIMRLAVRDATAPVARPVLHARRDSTRLFRRVTLQQYSFHKNFIYMCNVHVLYIQGVCTILSDCPRLCCCRPATRHLCCSDRYVL